MIHSDLICPPCYISGDDSIIWSLLLLVWQGRDWKVPSLCLPLGACLLWAEKRLWGCHIWHLNTRFSMQLACFRAHHRDIQQSLTVQAHVASMCILISGRARHSMWELGSSNTTQEPVGSSSRGRGADSLSALESFKNYICMAGTSGRYPEVRPFMFKSLTLRWSTWMALKNYFKYLILIKYFITLRWAQISHWK